MTWSKAARLISEKFGIPYPRAPDHGRASHYEGDPSTSCAKLDVRNPRHTRKPWPENESSRKSLVEAKGKRAVTNWRLTFFHKLTHLNRTSYITDKNGV